jgi:D-cysteine desulfhydrase
MTEPAAAGYPLLDHFPELSRIARVALAMIPTPVEPLRGAEPEGSLWVKRDDLTHDVVGGNKVRALEFLLGSVKRGDTVLTIGGEGSTHVLATAYHAARLGARTQAIRWQHEMSPGARAVAARAAELADVTTTRTIIGTGLHVLWRRARERRLHWIPMGGSSALGTLGHVNAALELVHQIDGGAMPRPARIILPLGTGGTAAGLVLGLAIAGARIPVVAARIGPRIGANRRRVLGLVRATAALIARVSRRPVPAPHPDALRVVHDVYGGAYGRSLPAGEHAARQMMLWRGLALDATYSAKAFAAAIAHHRTGEDPTLFWLTFDGRMLGDAIR